MKYGLALPYTTPRTVARLSQLAEESGWDGCLLGDANRSGSTPFDIVLNGKVADLDRSKLQDKLLPLSEAGATWWIEGLWDATEKTAVERIRRGPPSVEL